MKRTLKDRQIRKALRSEVEDQLEIRKIMRNEGRQRLKFHDLESEKSLKRRKQKIREWNDRNDFDDVQEIE